MNLVYTPSVSLTRLTCDIFEVPHENDGDAVDSLLHLTNERLILWNYKAMIPVTKPPPIQKKM